jgi:DUF4097 and DUF4098 domain-containing protein YvlB
VALLLLCSTAAAQSQLIDKVGSVFDDVARGLNLVGEKAQDLVGPGLGFGDSNAGGFVSSREFAERHPVGPAARVSVANEFGEIRVTTWDNQVVQVTAKISVRAESADLANAISQNIEIRVTPADNAVEVRTVLPDTRSEKGKPTIEVNYEVTAPRDASLAAKNDFGDTIIAGIGGAVAVDANFGAVDMRDIGGPVEVRARGEFALEAQELRQGGTFELHRVRANLRKLAGTVKVGNFWGSVTLRDLAPEAEVNVVSESGPITFYVAENPTPNIEATVVFGEIQSELPLSLSSQGDFTVGRNVSGEFKQRVTLRASFANIAIRRPAAEPTDQAAATLASQPFKEVTTQTEPVLENSQISIEVIPGDIRVVGTDESEIRVTATKFVRVQSQSNVRAAVQALDVRSTATEGQLKIRTAVTDNMAALGCTSYRVDLDIECPRTITVDIQAQEGHTAIVGLGGNAAVKQAAGSITVEHVKGEVRLLNQKGDVQVTECAGPVEVVGSYGAINLKDVYGKMTTTCTQGKTVIESPHAEIALARNTGGDIRILSLDGVAGNYDVHTDQGNISILLPPETDASITATAENGAVHSAIPLTGSIRKDLQEFVRNSAGPFRVTLQTKNGDIAIN